MINIKQLTCVAMILAGGTCLMAQTMGGAISGSVVDEHKVPLTGALIRVTGATLIQGRSVMSDAKGNFRVPLLPPGNYTLIATKGDFITVNVSNIRVGQDNAITQAIVMKKVPVAMAEVTVEAEAASAVEKGNVTTATSYSSSRLEALPTQDRGFDGAAALSPGLVGAQGGGYSIRGGTVASTNYRVNGADVNDPLSHVVSQDMVVQDNIEDLQIMLSPLHPRYGRATGGSINVTTKSGGNTFTGSIRATLDSGSWNATSVSDKYGSSENLNRRYEVVIGGPIIKDRLWFNVATILVPGSQSMQKIPDDYHTDLKTYNQPARSSIAAVQQAYLNGPGNGYLFSADPKSGGFTLNEPYLASSDQKYYEGKITYAVSSDHTVEFNYTDSQLNLYNQVGRSNYVVALRQLGDQIQDTTIKGVNYRGVFGSTSFLQAHYLEQNSKINWPSGDTHSGGTGEAIQFLLSNNDPNARWQDYKQVPGMGQGYNPTPEERGSAAGGIEFKKIMDAAGSHEIDLGYDYYRARRRTADQGGAKNLMINSVPGSYRNPTTGEWLFAVSNWDRPNSPYYQSGSGKSGVSPVVWQWTGHDGITTNENSALYLADLWTISPKVNLFMAWRQDFFKVTDTDGSTIANTSAPSPRAQIRWDVKGDATHLLDFSVARFNQDISTGFTTLFIKQATSQSVFRGWNAQKVNLSDVAANPALINQAVSFVPTSALIDVNNYGPAFAYTDSSYQNKVLGKLSAPYVDQFEVAYRHAFGDRSWFRVSLVHRDFKNMWAIDKDVTDGNTAVVPNPIHPANTNLQPVTYIYNTNIFKRTYNGIEMEWEKRLNSVFTFQGNYTYSHLVGNDDGGDQSVGTYNSTSPQQLLQNRSLKSDMGLTVNDYSPTGPLLNNVESRANLILLAIQPMGIGRITYSLALDYFSGKNFAAQSAAPYDWSAATFTPATSTYNERTYQHYYSDRGAYQENDSYHTNFKISWEVPLGFKTARLNGTLFVGNVFNHPFRYSYEHTFKNLSDGVTQLNLDSQDFGGSPKGQGKYYYDSGRTLQLSVGVKF